MRTGCKRSIDDRLVLELKVEPKKTERDRLIGQCCDYSVEWVTWAIVIDMPEEKVEALRDLLDKKSLHYIDVIPFSEIDHEDDEDVEDDDEDDEDQDEEIGDGSSAGINRLGVGDERAPQRRSSEPR